MAKTTHVDNQLAEAREKIFPGTPANVCDDPEIVARLRDFVPYQALMPSNPAAIIVVFCCQKRQSHAQNCLAFLSVLCIVISAIRVVYTSQSR